MIIVLSILIWLFLGLLGLNLCYKFYGPPPSRLFYVYVLAGPIVLIAFAILEFVSK